MLLFFAGANRIDIIDKSVLQSAVPIGNKNK